jgi:hypothetical protein
MVTDRVTWFPAVLSAVSGLRIKFPELHESKQLFN